MSIRTASLAASMMAGAILAGTGSTAAIAAPAAPMACPPDIVVSITSHSSYFLGAAGTHFKDGPGGTITASVTRTSTLSATLSASAEVSVSDVITSAKATVSGSITKSVSIAVGHTYSHNISAKKYGNLQYGSWGYKVNWERSRVNGNCKGVTVLSSGSATLPTSSVGWKYWETSS